MQIRRDWVIDGVQNWRQLRINGGLPFQNTVNNINEYTACGATLPSYDADGNQTSPDVLASPNVIYRYDFLNRLRQIHSGSSTVSLAYDAEGRRVRTATVGVSGAPPVVEYVMDGWEVIEERSSLNAIMRRFVMGVRLDEPVRLENISFYSGPGTYYYVQSTLRNVVALTNQAGSVIERYTYDAFGAPQYETPANAEKQVTQSDYGNPYLASGRRYDTSISPVIDNRHRMYDPLQGRFVQRDKPNQWADKLNVGNAYSYVANNPHNWWDPSGRDTYSVWVDAELSGGVHADVHLMTFTVQQDGQGSLEIGHVWSYGDRSTEQNPETGTKDGKVGWTSDTPEAKQEALSEFLKGKAKQEGDENLDKAMARIYEERKGERAPWTLGNNCITEGARLLRDAREEVKRNRRTRW
jgi:RHS repeat-associated protein